ncbi:hypothetical protein D6D20_09972, partial [Aureobasidium pullulans]
TSQSDAIQAYQALSDQSLSTQQSLSPNYGQSRAPDSPRLRQSHCAQHNDELPFDVAHDDELPFDVAHDDQVHDDDGSRASRHPGFSLGSYHGCGSDFEPEHSLHTVSTARPSGLAPSHNVDSSNRRRSRSPGPASNPALEDRNGGRSLDPGRYRGRSPLTCGEAGDTTDDSSTARDRHHAGEVAQPNQQTLSRIIAAAGQPGTLSGLESHHHTTLSVFEIEELKNKHVVCVHCWIKNLPCNHKAPCSQCVENNKACAYVACPVEHCTLEIKCPAVHLYTGIKGTHKTGSSMHLIALLNFKSDLLKDYDVSEIQKMHDDTRTMQNIYISLQKDIQQAAKQKKFDDHAARELLQRFKESNSIPDIGYDALCFKAGMLIRFLPQLKPIFATLLPLNDAEDLRHYYHKIVDYDSDDWKEATRMATSDGRVVKTIFEEALKLMLPCTRGWTNLNPMRNSFHFIRRVADQPYVRVPFDYNVSEWNVASRAALCHGRPVKYIFEQALSEMNARSYVHEPLVEINNEPRAQITSAQQVQGNARGHPAPIIRHQAPVNVATRRRSRSRSPARNGNVTAASHHHGARVGQPSGREQLSTHEPLPVRVPPPPGPPPPPPPRAPSRHGSGRRQVHDAVNPVPRAPPPRHATRQLNRDTAGHQIPHPLPPYTGHRDRNDAHPTVARQHPRRFAVDEGRPPFAADQPVSGQEARNLIALEKEAAALMRLMQELRHRDLLVLD